MCPQLQLAEWLGFFIARIFLPVTANVCGVCVCVCVCGIVHVVCLCVCVYVCMFVNVTKQV